MPFKNKNTKQMLMDFFEKYNLFVLFIVFSLVATLLSDKFLTFQNFFNLLQQSSVIGIVSIGMTFVIIVAGINLSVGSLVAVTGMTVAVLISNGYHFVLAILVSMLLGTVLGLIIGFISSKFTIPSFIVSLAMMVSARGLALLLTDGQPVFGLTGPFAFLGGGYIGPIPMSGILWITITLIAAFVLKYTSFGRKLYAIGGNEEASFFSGIKVNKYKVYAFGISGLLSAVGGIILTSWLTVGQPTAGQGMELDAIAAVVLGGTNLFGGSGGVIGTFFGVFLLAIITNIFNLLGLASYYQYIFKGIIIVAALILNRLVVAQQE